MNSRKKNPRKNAEPVKTLLEKHILSGDISAAQFIVTTRDYKLDYNLELQYVQPKQLEALLKELKFSEEHKPDKCVLEPANVERALDDWGAFEEFKKIYVKVCSQNIKEVMTGSEGLHTISSAQFNLLLLVLKDQLVAQSNDDDFRKLISQADPNIVFALAADKNFLADTAGKKSHASFKTLLNQLAKKAEKRANEKWEISKETINLLVNLFLHQSVENIKLFFNLVLQNNALAFNNDHWKNPDFRRAVYALFVKLHEEKDEEFVKQVVDMFSPFQAEIAAVVKEKGVSTLLTGFSTSSREEEKLNEDEESLLSQYRVNGLYAKLDSHEGWRGFSKELDDYGYRPMRRFPRSLQPFASNPKYGYSWKFDFMRAGKEDAVRAYSYHKQLESKKEQKAKDSTKKQPLVYLSSHGYTRLSASDQSDMVVGTLFSKVSEYKAFAQESVDFSTRHWMATEEGIHKLQSYIYSITPYVFPNAKEFKEYVDSSPFLSNQLLAHVRQEDVCGFVVGKDNAPSRAEARDRSKSQKPILIQTGEQSRIYTRQEQDQDDKVVRQKLKQVAKNLLEHKWEMGLFGGKKVVGPGNVQKKVPNGVNEILEIVEAVQQEKRSCSSALFKIGQICKNGQQSAMGRSQDTKSEYDKVWNALLGLK